MKRRIMLICFPIVFILIIAISIYFLTRGNDNRIELMAYYLNNNSSISFGKYENIELKSEDKTGLNVRTYSCKSEDKFNELKNELASKAYYIPQNSTNHLAFYEDNYYYGVFFNTKEINDSVDYEISVFPLCGYIRGMYPFVWGGTTKALVDQSNWINADEVYVEIAYEALKTPNSNQIAYNIMDIYSKDTLINYYSSVNSTYCKVEGNKIYLRCSSDINYNIKEYSLLIEAFDDHIKLIKLL